MNMQFQHGFVHLRTFGKTDRAPLQPFDPGAKIQVPPLDPLGTAFMNLMVFRRQIFALRLPIIRVKSTHLTGLVLFYQTPTTRIGAASQDKSRDLLTLPIPTVPAPVLLLFRLNERPEFIDFQVPDTPWWRRFWHLGSSSTDRLQHGVKTHAQDAHGVANTRAVEGHRHNQSAQRALTTAIGVARDELAATVFAQVALFFVGRFAILFDVP